MPHKRITSRDVALRAGVSRTTVSFVLNDVAGMKISEDTRQRVFQAARELGYIPDAAARTLASGKTLTLGLIVSHAKLIPVDIFVSLLLHGLYEVCREHGYRLLLETAEYADQPGAYMRLARAKQIDGLVVLSPREDDLYLVDLIESSYPLVFSGKYPHDAACSVAQESNPEATYYTTKHLLSLGHRRLCYIHFMPIYHPETETRLLGFKRALEEAGVPYDPSLVRPGEYSAASGYEAMVSLLEESPRPTALVAGNDTVAIGAMAAIHDAGLRIPEDIAVTGHDDIPTARFTVPALTTARIPAHEMGRRCGEMAIQLMAGEEPAERQVVFQSELVIRHSCGAKPITEPLDDD